MDPLAPAAHWQTLGGSTLSLKMWTLTWMAGHRWFNPGASGTLVWGWDQVALCTFACMFSINSLLLGPLAPLAPCMLPALRLTFV